MLNSTLKNYRVYLGFAQASDAEVDEFTSGVIDGLTDNAAFPNPPVPLKPVAAGQAAAAQTATDLTSLQLAFENAISAALQGGTQLTAAKNAAREALLDALHKTAMYVQSIARHDLAMLLSSGFEAASKNRSRTPLTKPAIQAVVNEISGQLLMRGESLLNSHSYQAQMMVVGNGNTWTDAGDFTGARRMVIQPVTPGTTYSLRYRGVGGSTGHSEWSDPISHMAT